MQHHVFDCLQLVQQHLTIDCFNGLLAIGAAEDDCLLAIGAAEGNCLLAIGAADGDSTK